MWFAQDELFCFFCLPLSPCSIFSLQPCELPRTPYLFTIPPAIEPNLRLPSGAELATLNESNQMDPFRSLLLLLLYHHPSHPNLLFQTPSPSHGVPVSPALHLFSL